MYLGLASTVVDNVGLQFFKAAFNVILFSYGCAGSCSCHGAEYSHVVSDMVLTRVCLGWLAEALNALASPALRASVEMHCNTEESSPNFLSTVLEF